VAKYTKWIDASPDEMISKVAVRSLRSRIEPVRDYLVLAAEESGKDTEYVHQVRVWSRRAVAAINIYRNLLPKRRRRWMKDQLNGIRRASNDARDDDVFAERLAADKDNPGAATLLKKVQSHRHRSQKPIAEIYGQLVDTGIFERRAEKLLERVRLRGVGNPKDKFSEWAVERIRPQLRKFFEAGEGDLTKVTALHQFRIRGKKLRYAVELLSGAFTDEIREVGHPLIRNLQDRLGEINDHATARVRLKSWMDHSDDKEEAAYLQEMLDDEQRQLAEKRSEFLSWWNGKREKDLRKAFASVVSGK